MKHILSLFAVLLLAVGLVQAQTIETIRLGQTVSGRLQTSSMRMSDNTYFVPYSFEARNGQTVTFTMKSSDFDAFLSVGYLENNEFQVVGSDDDSGGGTDAQITVTFTRSGTHYIRANALRENMVGAFTLQATAGSAAVEPEEEEPTFRRANVGDILEEQFTRTSPKLDGGQPYALYQVSLAAGATITILAQSDDFDPVLYFMTPTADMLAENDDASTGTDAGIEYTVSTAGEYIIGVRSTAAGATGTYILTVDGPDGAANIVTNNEPALTTGTAIVVGQPVYGELSASDPASNSRYVDTWTVRLTQGQTYTVTARSTTFDTFLGMVDGSEMVASDDDSGGGSDSRLTFTAPRTGSYSVMITSIEANGLGRYSIDVTQGSGGGGGNTGGGVRISGALQRNGNVTGRLESGDMTASDNTYEDYYTYEARRGESVTITLESTDFDAYLKLGSFTNGQYQFISSNDDGAGGTNSRITYTFTNAGTYVIIANSLSANETGRYTLSIRTN